MIRKSFVAAPAAVAAFGRGAAGAQAPDAEIWMNVGYETGDAKYPFVSLPFGIPVDTQRPLELRGQDATFHAFTAARNDLLEQIQTMASKLAPGEDVIISSGEGGLALQLRRRNGQAVAPAADTNPFARELFARELFVQPANAAA